MCFTCSKTIAKVRPWGSYSVICTSELAAVPSVSYLICCHAICPCCSRNVIKRAPIAWKPEFYGRVSCMGDADKSTNAAWVAFIRSFNEDRFTRNEMRLLFTAGPHGDEREPSNNQRTFINARNKSDFTVLRVLERSGKTNETVCKAHGAGNIHSVKRSKL